MTPDDFASLARALGPNVVVRPILEAVQFQVGGKAFATLGWPAQGWAVVKLDPRDQAWGLALSDALAPEPGRRRKSGIVLARLSGLDAASAAELLAAAWSHGQRRSARQPAKVGLEASLAPAGAKTAGVAIA